ncbi:DNA polymerase III subunit gamma/tau [bacterium]|nr:DNA polymerase III subunit gamma/tau [bacterium]
MSYLVLARKYRPLVFGDIVAQQHVSRTLVNAIAGGRISHAYLFSGPRGVGKTSTARILARAVNCLSPVGQDPCNQCEICREIIQGSSLDVLEIDGASNRGIDEIRDLRERVGYSPSRNRYKIYIIDEVHMLTQEAFNALLKTLEEPPSHVIFIFATTAPHKVPPTILSRCQRFDFKAVPPAEMQAHLQGVLSREGLSAPPEVLEMVTRKAGGAMRDALSLLDQVIAFCGVDFTAELAAQVLGVFDSELFLELSGLLAERDSLGVVGFVDRLVDSGVDLEEFFQELTAHIRNLIVLRLGADPSRLEDIPAAYRERYGELAGRFAVEDLVRSLHLVLGFEETFKRSSQQRICLELLLIRLALLERSADIAELIARLESESGAPSAAARARTPAAPPPAPRQVRDSGQPAAAPATGVPPKPAAPVRPQVERSAAQSAPAASAPAPEATPPAAAKPQRIEYSGPADLELIRRHWPKIVQQVKLKRNALGLALGAATPGAFDSRRLSLDIDRTRKFDCEKLRAAENRSLVSSILDEILGLSGLDLELHLVDSAPGPSGERPPASVDESPAAQSFEMLCRTDPALSRVNELFNPELI